MVLRGPKKTSTPSKKLSERPASKLFLISPSEERFTFPVSSHITLETISMMGMAHERTNTTSVRTVKRTYFHLRIQLNACDRSICYDIEYKEIQSWRSSGRPEVEVATKIRFLPIA